MDRLHVEAERTAQAAPATVWALVSDATMYPRWGPWTEAGYRRPGDTSPGGPGAVYWLRSVRRNGLRRLVMVEKILDVEEGRRLAYTVIGGIPVRNYRGEVTLSPDAGGTRIRWTADWDRTLRGRLVHGPLRKAYPQIVGDLARAAEKQAAPVQG